MNYTSSFILVGIVFAIIGALTGYLVFKIKNRPDKKMEKILNSPELLIKELKKQGKIYDIGPNDERQEIEFEYDSSKEGGSMIIKRHSINPNPVHTPTTHAAQKKGTQRNSSRRKVPARSSKLTSRRSSMTERP